MNPRPLALAFAGLLSACAAAPAEPLAPPPAAPPPAASSAAVPASPPSPSSSGSPSPSASAPGALASAAPSSAPPAPPRPSSCEGQAIDLGAALADKGCLAPYLDEPPPASAVKVTLSPAQPRVKSGEWLSFDVTLENTGDGPVELRFAAPLGGFLGGPGAFGSEGLGSAFGGGASRGHLGGGKKKKARPRPNAPPPEPTPEATPSADVSAADAKGRDVDHLQGVFGMIGLIGAKPSEEVRVTIAPGGRLTARAHWLARGYDPAKSYIPKNANPNEGFMMPAKEPLKPGDYQLTVDVGARGKGAPVARVKARVE